MLELFWRRKNARLVERLNAAVETSERVREQYENRPRRAVIDTSYVDTIAAQERAERRRPHLVAQVATEEHEFPARGPEAEGSFAVEEEGERFEGYDQPDDVGAQAGWNDQQDPEESEELALVREAVEQLELANAREADALAREAEANAHIETLLERIAALETARDDAGHADVDVVALNRRIDELEATVAGEQTARRATKAECELAQVSLRDAEAEIARLNDRLSEQKPAAQLTVAAPAGDPALQSEVTSLRDRLKRAEIAIAKETATRREMEASRDRAHLNAQELEHELELLRASAAATADNARLADEAKARSAELSEALDEVRARATRLEEDLKQESTARWNAEARQADIVRERDGLESEVANLRAQIAEFEADKERHGETAARLAELEARIETAQGEALDLSTKLESERASREAAESAAADARSRMAALQEELSAFKRSSTDEVKALQVRIDEAEGARQAAEARAAEVASRLDALEDDLAAAGAALLAESEKREATEREAQQSAAAAAEESAAERLAAAQKHRDEALEQASRIKAQLETAHRQASDAELARQRAEDQLAEARSELAMMAGASEAAAAEHAAAPSQEDHARMRAELDDVRSQLERARADSGLAEDARRAHDDVVEELTAAKLSLEHELVELRQRVADLDVRAGAGQSETEAAQAEIGMLRDRIERLDVAVAHERAARREAEAELERMLATVSEARAEMASLRIAADRFDELQRKERDEKARLAQSDVALAWSSDEDLAWKQGVADADASDASTGETQEQPGSEQSEAEQQLAVLVEHGTKSPGFKAAATETPKPPRADAVKRAIAAATSKRGHPSAASNRRNQSRTTSQMQVTLWKEGMSHALPCTLIDKSSTGAKVEFRLDGYGPRFSVGDRMTLTFNYALERTSVFCDVMWIDGEKCGVKYYGQFVTQQAKPVRNVNSGGRFGRG